jgi:S-adenosylmethionine:tRNA ribosyltransferase-isomerase
MCCDYMHIDDYDYTLPKELIAQYPKAQRTDSRLLYLYRLSGEVEDCQFEDLFELLNPGDLLVLNNSKVMPARLYGRKATGGKVELLLERVISTTEVLSHVKVSKALKPGGVIALNDVVKLVMQERDGALYRFKLEGADDVFQVMEQFGHMPLPPYMEREDELSDQSRYQTVYARYDGSVAAPTAGLHFNEALLNRLGNKGVQVAELTLHVGAGTFQPIKVGDIKEHVMHQEWFEVSQSVCEQIMLTKQRGGRVIAVGTTTVRSLETAALSGKLQPYQGETDIFIYPGFNFQVIDGMVTNFHLPRSTLLLLVSAFASREKVLAAYSHAIEQQYRFFSYGDAMLIV